MRSFHSECRQYGYKTLLGISYRCYYIIILLYHIIVVFVYTKILLRHKKTERKNFMKNISTARDQFTSHFLVGTQR